jgi:hypothetical protein
MEYSKPEMIYSRHKIQAGIEGRKRKNASNENKK